MRRFNLREQLVIKFLLADFILISFIGFLLLVLIDNYQAAITSIWLLLLSSPVVFIISWYFSSRINKKLENLNNAISNLAKGDYELKNTIITDEFDQVLENLIYTSHKIAKDDIKHNQEINDYKIILNNLSNGVLLVNNSAEIVFANHALEKIFNNKDWRNKEVIEAFQNHDLAALVDKGMLGKASSERIDITYPKPKILAVTCFPIEGNNQIIKGCAVLIYDSTAYERLADVKRDLLANVSHELRTPVASIKSLTDALTASKLENKELAFKFLSDIQYESERLSLLVNDVLDLSKIESVHTQKLESISIDSLLKEVSNSHMSKYKEKNITLNIVIEKDLSSVSADKNQLYKTFSNLLDNAVKFTGTNGSIDIEAKQEEDFVVIAFKDTGEGIMQKDMERIFERFYTGSKDRSDIPGTGLGLSIAKHAIEKHKGFIKVASIWGKGSTFKVYLPYKHQRTKDNKKSTESLLPSK